MISHYPVFSNITLEMRPELHPLFKGLSEGISEFTFANLYLFQEIHNYQISLLSDILLIKGRDGDISFFMLPFGLTEKKILDELFHEFNCMKCVSESQASLLAKMNYTVSQDRDNFDYLYLREELVSLPGPKYHKKRTLINAFVETYSYEGKPLTADCIGDPKKVLDMWRDGRDDPGDYYAAKEALENVEELQLCGGIYYVDGQPAAYTLGEELAMGTTFAIHFEKAIGEYKGLYQFINQSFASILPPNYKTINREQDLGDKGLRQAKMTYRPVGFIKKYQAWKG